MPLPNHKVTICGIPELSQHCSVGVSHVLSIIDTHEPRPPVLDSFSVIDHELIRFDDVVAEYPGFEACTPAHIVKVLEFGERVHARPGSHVLVHCHAGISRSTAAMAMILAQAHPEADDDRLFRRLAEIRPQAWPNSMMIGFADDLLGRQGRMTAALRRLYARQLAARPHLADTMRGIGRGREVDMALLAKDAA